MAAGKIENKAHRILEAEADIFESAVRAGRRFFVIPIARAGINPAATHTAVNCLLAVFVSAGTILDHHPVDFVNEIDADCAGNQRCKEKLEIDGNHFGKTPKGSGKSAFTAYEKFLPSYLFRKIKKLRSRR